MARTRVRRRRQTVYLSATLALTLIVLLFARDVNRAAHSASGPRRSENRSFGQMVNFLVTGENSFDAHLAYLLRTGQGLSRPIFAARLTQLSNQLPSWATTAELLRRPVLAHHVNDVVANITEQRVDDYESLLADVARRLQLPWPTVAANQVVSSPVAALALSVHQWGVARFSLTREPGRVTLSALTQRSATLYAASGVASLVSSPSLALVRGIGIAAVEVQPTPLPAAASVLLLPPVTSVHLGVSVQNTAYTDQPVTLTVTFTPSSGAVQRQVERVTIGPLSSYAFVPSSLVTRPSERATLSIVVGGAPAGPGLATARTYVVEMSPSGNG